MPEQETKAARVIVAKMGGDPRRYVTSTLILFADRTTEWIEKCSVRCKHGHGECHQLRHAILPSGPFEEVRDA